MKELSIFIDESGDFGVYDYHSPFYIITMVFHVQDIPLDNAILNLNHELTLLGLSSHCIHTGPIIRQEEDYRFMTISERRRIFNKMITFIKQVDIRYKSFYIEKKHIKNAFEATGKLSKSISSFIFENYSEFLSYETVKIYYDNGQIEVNKLLSSVFHSLLPNVEFRKVIPSQYKLFQVADLFCTFELIHLKLENSTISRSELLFFGNIRNLKKNYLKPLSKKSFTPLPSNHKP